MAISIEIASSIAGPARGSHSCFGPWTFAGVHHQIAVMNVYAEHHLARKRRQTRYDTKNRIYSLGSAQRHAHSFNDGNNLLNHRVPPSSMGQFKRERHGQSRVCFVSQQSRVKMEGISNAGVAQGGSKGAAQSRYCKNVLLLDFNQTCTTFFGMIF